MAHHVNMFYILSGITCYSLVFGVVFLWYARHRSAQMAALLDSGAEAKARVSQVKQYRGKGGIYLIVDYSFEPAAGLAQKGRQAMLLKKIKKPEIYQEGAFVTVIYTDANPKLRCLKEEFANTAEAVHNLNKVMNISTVVNVVVIAFI